jgi:hypothetical protein
MLRVCSLSSPTFAAICALLKRRIAFGCVVIGCFADLAKEHRGDTPVAQFFGVFERLVALHALVCRCQFQCELIAPQIMRALQDMMSDMPIKLPQPQDLSSLFNNYSEFFELYKRYPVVYNRFLEVCRLSFTSNGSSS